MVKLAATGCTNAEIAVQFGVHESTISRRFAGSLQKGRELRKRLLRQRQTEVALQRNVGAAPTVTCSRDIIAVTKKLTYEIRNLGDVLAPDSPAASDLRGILDEVGKSYESVNSAILRFKVPAAKPSLCTQDANAFMELEDSDLGKNIRNGRGHCALIHDYYFKAS